MTAHIILSAVLLVFGVWLVRFCMRSALICQFCGKTDVKVWDKVTDQKQKSILEYFRSYERREPNTGRILVCDECNTVFDDFAGSKGRGEIESHTVGYGSKTKTIITCNTWCKVCGNVVMSCDPDNDNIHCRACETRYQWKLHEPSGYRFLMPPKGTKLLNAPNDQLGSA